MPASPTIFSVFGHFQNLNLLALLHDLRAGQTVRHSWFSGSLLCPIAHGLADGDRVRELRILGQTADPGVGCDRAARQLQAEPDSVLRFVRLWDEGMLSAEVLLRQLEELWAERLTDAEAVQELLQEQTTIGEPPGQEADEMGSLLLGGQAAGRFVGSSRKDNEKRSQPGQTGSVQNENHGRGDRATR